jgi:hypothetical protein
VRVRLGVTVELDQITHVSTSQLFFPNPARSARFLPHTKHHARTMWDYHSRPNLTVWVCPPG